MNGVFLLKCYDQSILSGAKKSVRSLHSLCKINILNKWNKNRWKFFSQLLTKIQHYFFSSPQIVSCYYRPTKSFNYNRNQNHSWFSFLIHYDELSLCMRGSNMKNISTLSVASEKKIINLLEKKKVMTEQMIASQLHSLIFIDYNSKMVHIRHVRRNKNIPLWAKLWYDYTPLG